VRMGNGTQPPAGRRGSRARTAFRLVPAGALGVAAALLVSCGASTAKLIPAASAGPLQSDFEEIAQAARTGNGNCSETEAKILKTEQDFNSLRSTVDSWLRNTLRQGIANLRKHALELCRQPLAQPTQATTAPKTTTTPHTTPTTPTQTQTTTTTPTTPSTTPTTPTTSGPGGGTPAPEHEPTPEGGGTKPGENGGGANGGAGAGGQEGGK
jgi:hypothetical protein